MRRLIIRASEMKYSITFIGRKHVEKMPKHCFIADEIFVTMIKDPVL